MKTLFKTEILNHRLKGQGEIKRAKKVLIEILKTQQGH